ncbi:MAG: DNA polymerase III subunit delta [Legionellaceae bacterium]|nr:DNA polymerase III subunit delta [Legionellaceae bacterium]
MMIKNTSLAHSLQNTIAPLYCLTGQDHFLINEATQLIKKAWRSKGECDEKIVYINSTADWALCVQEANSYSLFAPYVLLDIRYEKKTIDASGKACIQAYLDNINPKSLVLIQATQVPTKQLQWLSNHKNAMLVQAIPLTASGLQSWIAQELQRRTMNYESSVPALIHQYSQNNMLACAQVIEKLSLINTTGLTFSIELVKEHLTDQCEYPLYDLADACLAANADKVIHLLRQVSQNRGEPTFILWLLSQEIRQLIQLSQHMNQSVPWNTACNQLKIWPQRVRLYEMAIKRFTLTQLYPLLQRCQQLDVQIKSTQSTYIWNELEHLALSICKNNRRSP